jgi:hypothetical protein
MQFQGRFDATLSGLNVFVWNTQGSRKDAATLGWMMEYLRHSLRATLKVYNRLQVVASLRGESVGNCKK